MKFHEYIISLLDDQDDLMGTRRVRAANLQECKKIAHELVATTNGCHRALYRYDKIGHNAFYFTI